MKIKEDLSWPKLSKISRTIVWPIRETTRDAFLFLEAIFIQHNNEIFSTMCTLK